MTNTIHMRPYKHLAPGKLYKLNSDFGLCTYKNNKIMYQRPGDIVYIVDLYNLKVQNVPLLLELNLVVDLICKFGQCLSYYNNVKSLYYQSLRNMELIS